MGEIAESMLDGSCCQVCGEWLGEAVGYAVTCAACGDGEPLMSDGQQRRARNREQSNLLLRENGYEFDERNGAAHLIVRTARGTVDFWPGTGKWITRFEIDGCRVENRGVFNLMKFAAPARAAVDSPLEIQWKPHMTELALLAYRNAGFIVTGAPAETQGGEAC
ncbi:hypothetical protein L0Z11_11460 [Burkholderia multivorans]|uniref:hypothetical protein n=1 Tax=Burkholderia multivorans TaxID=87883 RepID=UPI0020195741|nr:hypothetical protein [Burkholderia multivorans]UQN68303.1 hypothetical protein L0Z45_11480 [Burkholderia multivorans]UQN74032.1 hypothetical protein L0Z11_11460 [Burkholderia multivorans]